MTTADRGPGPQLSATNQYYSARAVTGQMGLRIRRLGVRIPPGALLGENVVKMATERSDTGTIEEEQTGFGSGDGEHDRFRHYVRKDKLTEALINGTPVRALCGKVWVPSRDPSRYPTCPECRRLYELLPGEPADV